MDTVEKIERIIEHIRPYINADGGDLEFVSYENNIVTVRLTGACIGCGMVDMTLNEGVKQWIMDEIPEVVDVVMEASELNIPDELIDLEGFDF